MKLFMVTFMQRHPLRDHWIEVVAPDEDTARKEVFSVFGDKWAFIYEEKNFNPEYFPGGMIGRTIYA